MGTIVNENSFDLLLKTISTSKRITYLCGAGFSMAIGEHTCSWKNWINEGLKYLNSTQKEKISSLLALNDAESLINAAGLLIEELNIVEKYAEFMNSTIETITPKQKDLIEALKLIVRNGDLVATTNYDLTIEKSTNLKPITYNSAGEILKILKEESENKILHLHGAYSYNYQINDIVATPNQYNEIVANQGAQFVQNLLSTNPIVIIGCGGTVEDPNLKNFLQFSTKYLSLDVPYFYLHCKKESLDGLPDKFIPVCYGDSYEELPSFLLDIAMTRVRENLNIRDICRVNPYLEIQTNNSAYSRMHYTTKYLDFIGRKEELSNLNEFISGNESLSWWMVTGEAGIGKSRLLLEWLSKLPSDWFGFFANINESCIDKYNDFKPFSNTAIILDYVAGQEKSCASIIKILTEVFEKSIYKLRIILVERHYEPDKKDWFFKLKDYLNPTDKIKFDNAAYSKSPIQPLKIGKLKYDEENEYIKKYLKKYIIELNNESLNEQYLKNLNSSTKKIHKAYKKMLKGLFQRPLYLSIFIEVWIDKAGDFTIKNSEELLECYIEKEEKRWLERFGNDRQILNAYLKLLSLACAIEMLCVNEDNFYYQKPSDIFYNFLLSEEQAGIRKTSWTDLFTYSKINENNPSEYHYIIEPLYPDIIREFIVLYYINKEECDIFARTARKVSVIQLSMFLMHALEDFPNNDKFIEMVLTPPNEDCEYFDYFLGLISKMFDLPNHDRAINILLNTSPQVTEDFGIYELYTWKQLAEVLGYRLFEGMITTEKYIETANKFTDLVNKKWNIKNVKESVVEIFEVWFKGLHNSENTEQAEKYLNSIKNIIDKMPKDDNLFAEVATIYCECYQKLLVLHARSNDYQKCKKDIKIIEGYYELFPEDDDIYDSYLTAICDYVLKLCSTQEITLIKEVLPKLKKLYSEDDDEELAECLATIYANFYIKEIEKYIYTEENFNENDEQLKTNEKEIVSLLNEYPQNEKITVAFASIKSNFLMTKYVRNQNVNIDDEFLYRFRDYYQKWSDNVEFIDAYGKILYIKIINLISNLGDKKRIQILLQELEQLEINTRSVYQEYADPRNDLKGFIRTIKDAIELQNAIIDSGYY